MYKKIEFNSYTYKYTSSTNQTLGLGVSVTKLMTIYFFIPQISKTNEDRGWEPGRRSGKREQKLKRQSFVAYYR